MPRLLEWLRILSVIIPFQVILSDDGTFIMEHSIQWEKDVQGVEGNTSLADFLHQTKIVKHERNTKPKTGHSLSSQFDNSCTGKQPCTCYYPDHPNVTIFELGTDATTQNASGISGTGPENCDDLQKLGYTLMGFYMIRFNSKRVKTTYCEFNETINKNETNKSKRIERALKHPTRKPSKPNKLRFCGGVGHAPCSFYYSDNPDSPLNSRTLNDSTANNNYKVEPKSCEDLGKIGYFLKGFYTVRLNAIKVKIVYCEFEKSIFKNGKTILKKIRPTIDKNATEKLSKIPKFCQGIGSQPCSCYFSNSQNILQYDLSSDEITRNAAKPENCNDLNQLGHLLDGFYMVRYSKKVMKIVFCKFDGKNKDHKPKIRQPKKSKRIDKMKEWLQVTAFLQTTSNPVTDEEESTTEVTLTNTQTSSSTAQTFSTITQTSSTTMKPAPKIERPELVDSQPSKPEANNQPCYTRHCNGNNKKHFGHQNSWSYPRNDRMKASGQYRNKGIQNKNKVYPSVDVAWQVPTYDGSSPYGRRRRDHSYDKRSYLLKNQYGKCLESSTNDTLSRTNNGTKIVQSNCNPQRKGQLWKLIEDHICNDLDKCLSLPIDWNPENFTLGIILSDRDIHSRLQKWKFEGSGYIVNQYHCLEVFLDSEADGAEIKMGRCGSGRKSQSWYFKYV